MNRPPPCSESGPDIFRHRNPDELSKNATQAEVKLAVVQTVMQKYLQEKAKKLAPAPP